MTRSILRSCWCLGLVLLGFAVTVPMRAVTLQLTDVAFAPAGQAILGAARDGQGRHHLLVQENNHAPYLLSGDQRWPLPLPPGPPAALGTRLVALEKGVAIVHWDLTTGLLVGISWAPDAPAVRYLPTPVPGMRFSSAMAMGAELMVVGLHRGQPVLTPLRLAEATWGDPLPAPSNGGAATTSLGLSILRGQLILTLEREGEQEVYRRDGPGPWTRLTGFSPESGAHEWIAWSMGQSHVLYLPRIGHSPSLPVYNEVTGVWARYPSPPGMQYRGEGFSSGRRTSVEIYVTAESGQLQRLVLTPRQPRFGWVNYVLLFTYLAGTMGLGWYFMGRTKGTKDYFLSGGRIPWWAAGISVYATMLSPITVMAMSGKAYLTNWTFWAATTTILMLAPLVIRWYLPFFRRLSTASAYEYLEHRFNLLLRLYASAAFIIFQMGRMAIVIFLPSLAISTVTGIDLTLGVLLMGGVCTLYTMLGGIEGVIWNDVIQAVVMVGSALACIVMVIISLEGSLFELAAEAWHDGKLQTLDWSWSYVYATTWLIVGGGFFNNLVPYTSDQTVIQRYITTKDEAAARRSIWLNGIISPPSALVFFGLGSALYLYYKHQPQALHPEVAPDSLLPLFAVEVMPMGMAGVVIAGIFAASQSSVSSSLNSVATVCITDILGRRLAASSDNRRLFLARAATGLTGVISTVAALVIATRNIGSFLDAYLAIVALTGSGLAALFALGIFTRTSNALGATVGVIGSALVLFAVTKFTSLHFFLFGVIGFSTCAALGWTVSWLTGGSRKQLSGLTIRD